ncbi:MAG: hypothetical protein ACRDO2_07875 [Nocardioidaceae bacterium]
MPSTFLDHNYVTAIKHPTADKPQSKLWYTDGSWWALMVPSGVTRVDIFRLNTATHNWVDTGTVVDTVANSTGDALWKESGQTLTVVSRDANTNARVTRFSYDASTDAYTQDAGFPVTLNTGGGSESATIDQDTTGRLWVTYTRNAKLWVTHSDPSGLSWTPGYNPAVGDFSLRTDDISSLIAFDGQIGLMWSDQGSNAVRFATHQDGAGDQQWSVENALVGTRMADDHINLKHVAGDGRIFAAVKTSADPTIDPPSTPLVGVLIRTPGAGSGPGSWEFQVTGTLADDHTRPLLMVDQANQELYFLATAPEDGGDIYYKKTSLSDPDFNSQPGRGTKMMDAKPQLNNVTGSKAPATSASGLVLMAVSEGQKRYVHSEMELAGGPPGDIEDPSIPQDLQATPDVGLVNLSWDPSTDDVGVTSYVVRRNGQVVGEPAQTSFTDTSVTPGATYDYTVSAKDAADNESAQSDPATATVPSPPGGVITLEGATTAANNAERTLVLPVPTADSGDLLLASVSFRGQPTITSPAGWTLVRRDVNGTVMQQAIYWKFAEPTEPSEYTWTFSTRPAAVGSMLTYSGVSSSGPIQTSDAATASSKLITAPSVTTSAPYAMLVGFFGVARLSTIAEPPSMTELTEVAAPPTVSYPVTGESAGELRTVVGNTGTRVATSSISGPNIGQIVVLNPA